MLRSWPLLFIVVPVVELYCIIAVGEIIGAFWTVILVLLTAIIGVNLMRFQGMSTLARAQQNIARGQVPAMEMMEGVALAFAGVLLLTPGFITDTIGFLCLIPPTRRLLIQFLMKKASVKSNVGGFQSNQYQQENQQYKKDSTTSDKPKVGRTIEGEYKRED